MAYYRCYFLGEHEQIVGFDKIYCLSDAEAIRTARESFAGQPAERVSGWTLFNHDRCVMPATMRERRADEATDSAAPHATL